MTKAQADTLREKIWTLRRECASVYDLTKTATTPLADRLRRDCGIDYIAEHAAAQGDA